SYVFLIVARIESRPVPPVSRRIALQLLAAHAWAVRAASGQTQSRARPKPLSAGAVTSDWPSFLGPSHDAASVETKLSRTLPPPLVWEFPRGTGYADRKSVV